MADKVHCIRKTLRLMPEEAKMLAKKACDNGMNEAEYIRLLISQKPNDYPEVRKILKELINEVNRIGININIWEFMVPVDIRGNIDKFDDIEQNFYDNYEAYQKVRNIK